MVREEVRADLVGPHGDLQTLAQRGPHVFHEFVEVHAVRVVGDVGHDLLEDRVLAPRARAEGAGVAEARCVRHTLVSQAMCCLC